MNVSVPLISKIAYSTETKKRTTALSETCVKFERFREHRLGKPDSSERVKKTLVVIVCHATTVLDFTDHVAHRSPRYALRKNNESL